MRRFAVMIPIMFLALASCHPMSSDTNVSNAWVRLSAVKGQPAAAYFTITGGAQDDSLFAVNTDVTLKTEIHETEDASAVAVNSSGNDMGNMAGMGDMKGMSGMGNMSGMSGMSTMKKLGTVPIPAHTTITFAPGGKHVMLFGVDPGVKPGGTMMLTLVFKSGLQLQDNAVVVAAGDAAPKF